MLETLKNPALLKLDLALRGVDAPWAADAKWLELQLDGEIWARARVDFESPLKLVHATQGDVLR